MDKRDITKLKSLWQFDKYIPAKRNILMLFADICYNLLAGLMAQMQKWVLIITIETLFYINIIKSLAN